jgi:hypothetical protein
VWMGVRSLRDIGADGSCDLEVVSILSALLWLLLGSLSVSDGLCLLSRRYFDRRKGLLVINLRGHDGMIVKKEKVRVEKYESDQVTEELFTLTLYVRFRVHLPGNRNRTTTINWFETHDIATASSAMTLGKVTCDSHCP